MAETRRRAAQPPDDAPPRDDDARQPPAFQLALLAASTFARTFEGDLDRLVRIIEG